MQPKKIIPTFDFYKTLDPRLNFAFSQLEESYNSYNAALPHRHNYFEILLFKGSGGLHEIDFNSYEVVQNSLHFISPEQVHILRREKPAKGESTVIIPVVLDDGLSVRANLTIDAGLLEAIDTAASRAGVTRSAFVANAAREKLDA